MSLMILKSKIFQRKTASAMNHLEFQVENNTIRRFVNPKLGKSWTNHQPKTWTLPNIPNVWKKCKRYIGGHQNRFTAVKLTKILGKSPFYPPPLYLIYPFFLPLSFIYFIYSFSPSPLFILFILSLTLTITEQVLFTIKKIVIKC